MGHLIVLTGEGLGASEESSLAPYARGSRSSRTGSIAAARTSERCAASERMSEEYRCALPTRPLGRRIRAGVGVGGALSSEPVSSSGSGGGWGTLRTWCGLGEGGTGSAAPFSSEITGITSGAMGSASRGLRGALKSASFVFDASEWRDCGVFPGVLSCNAGRRRVRIGLVLEFYVYILV